jgi:uroporphyrinogen III methyltransferase/synthase
LDTALERLASYRAIVFTSVNGVEMFWARATRAGRGRPRVPRRLFAIGPATAAALRRRGAMGASVPDEFEGEALARHLLDRIGSVKGARILIPRAKVARDALPRLLRAAGASVDVVEAYQTLPDSRGLLTLKRMVADPGEGSIVTFTSSSTVHQFMAAVGAGPSRGFFRRAAAASIGPITSKTLRGYGIRPAIEAKPYNVVGLVRALARLKGKPL